MLYPASDSPALAVSERDRQRARDIVASITDGTLPRARLLTSVQQEVFDHLHNEAGHTAVREMLEFLRQNPSVEFHTPSQDVVVAGRQIVYQRPDFEFADGQIAAYLNQLDQEHCVVYTVDSKFDNFPGITALPTPYNPYDDH